VSKLSNRKKEAEMEVGRGEGSMDRDDRSER